MQESFYREILEALADGVYFVDRNRKVTYWNQAAERLSGYSAREVIGKSCAERILRHVDMEGRPLCEVGCPLAETMRDGRVREAEVFLHHKYGHRVPVSVRASPMRDDDGVIVGAVEIFHENSRALNILEELEALRQEVLHDPLTEVGNRRYAEVTLENLDHTMVTSGVPYGVLMVDIDHFKRVNDTWGHPVGDKVLTMVAKTLQATLRPLDVLCRWGGEEFILLVPNSSLKSLRTVASRLGMLVESSWVKHEGQLIAVTVSLGGALAQPGESPAQVVERADAELYCSKNAGRNCGYVDGVFTSARGDDIQTA